MGQVAENSEYRDAAQNRCERIHRGDYYCVPSDQRSTIKYVLFLSNENRYIPVYIVVEPVVGRQHDDCGHSNVQREE